MSDDIIEVTASEKTPRTLDELLKLDTYQGMTDVEIDIVIEWHVRNAVQDAEFKAQANLQQEQIAVLYGREMEKARLANETLRELVGLTGNYESNAIEVNNG